MKMKRLLTYVIALLLSGQMVAQECPFLGVWQKKDGVWGKIFLAEGKMYGYSLDKNSSNLSTWLMGDYRVLNDSAPTR